MVERGLAVQAPAARQRESFGSELLSRSPAPVNPATISDSIARWTLRVAAFALPLAFLPNVVDEFVLPKLLLLRVVLVALTILLLLRWSSEGAILEAGVGVLGRGYFRDPSRVIRADVPLAHPDFAGIFLAMLLPVALAKVVSRRSLTTRMRAANLF